MSEVKRIERGWIGHFILGEKCRFRRNTLLIYEDLRIIVSTVGLYVLDEKVEQIALKTYYETKLFFSNGDKYDDADVTKPVYIDTKTTIDDIYDGVDLDANQMHEDAVTRISEVMVTKDWNNKEVKD